MKIRPHRDRIVVKVLEADTVSAGGIVIPDAATEKPNKGKVIAVGTGRLTESGTVVPMEVKQNDIVLFGKHAGQNVKVNGEEFLILVEDDVMAVIEE
jgi:chaperonin GroES